VSGYFRSCFFSGMKRKNTEEKRTRQQVKNEPNLGPFERKLKYHEKKLLKKTNFVDWKKEGTPSSERVIIARFQILNRDQYLLYVKLTARIRKAIHMLKDLKPDDPLADSLREALVEKLYDMGIIKERSVGMIGSLNASDFCRRRLSTILVKHRYCETIKEANRYIIHGHIRVGTDIVKDPGFLVTRRMEDFIHWVDTSKMKKTILAYNDKLDDYDLLN